MVSGSRFATRVVRSLRHRLGYPPRVAPISLGGFNILAREGLVRPSTDKDDGWTAALVLDSQVFLDLGCNVGLFCVFGGITSASRIVIAWDTNPAALTFCAENLFLNGISQRARFILGFASAKANEQLKFYTVGTGSAGSRYPGHARTAFDRGSVSVVRTLTVDQVLGDLDLIPDLVKIDIEGAEAEALAGARLLALHGKPRIIVEMHSPPELPMIENCRQVLAWCQEVGYRAFYLREHAQITAPDVIAHRGRCHLLLIPLSAQYPLWLKTIPENSPVEVGISGFKNRKKKDYSGRQ